MNENINNKNRPSKNDYGKNYVSILGYPDFENADGQLIKEKQADSEEVCDYKISAEKDNEVLRNENLSKPDLSAPGEELDDNEEGLYSVREANTLIGLSAHKIKNLLKDTYTQIQHSNETNIHRNQLQQRSTFCNIIKGFMGMI